jgi:hypothetical protein
MQTLVLQSRLSGWDGISYTRDRACLSGPIPDRSRGRSWIPAVSAGRAFAGDVHESAPVVVLGNAEVGAGRGSWSSHPRRTRPSRSPWEGARISGR